MQRFLKIAAGLTAATVLAAGHAQASTWILDYTATNGATPTEADLTLDVSDVQNLVGGGFNVLGITGQVDGDSITGLIANPNSPNASTSADGWFTYDNVFYAGQSPVLSNPGLLFTSASGAEYNLFSDNATTYELYQARAGVGYTENSVGALTAVGVPEPASWTLMIVGFGGMGAILRRRRQVQAAPVAA
jgi:hypothetical protein